MISVIIPCYNCVDTLGKCVESILNQTYRNLEVLLIDDGSPEEEGTGKLCDILAKSDKRIITVHQENRGLVGAWKRGVREAKGNYIAFVDSDDWIEKNAIERLYTKIVQFNAEIAVGGMVLDYKNGKKAYHDNMLKEGLYSREDIEKEILPLFYHYTTKMESRALVLSRCGKIFKKELLLKNYKLFDERISYGEDDMTIFLSVLSAQSLYCFNTYFPYHYCRNSDSMIGKYEPDSYKKCLILHRKLMEIARQNDYLYIEQLEIHFLENCMVNIKKSIHRDKQNTLLSLSRNINSVMNEEELKKAFRCCKKIIRQYGLKERLFIELLKKKQYLLCIFMVRIAVRLSVGAE